MQYAPFTFFEAMTRLKANCNDKEWDKLKGIIQCRLVTLDAAFYKLHTSKIGVWVKSIRGTTGLRVATVYVQLTYPNHEKYAAVVSMEDRDEVRFKGYVPRPV